MHSLTCMGPVTSISSDQRFRLKHEDVVPGRKGGSGRDRSRRGDRRADPRPPGARSRPPTMLPPIVGTVSAGSNWKLSAPYCRPDCRESFRGAVDKRRSILARAKGPFLFVARESAVVKAPSAVFARRGAHREIRTRVAKGTRFPTLLSIPLSQWSDSKCQARTSGIAAGRPKVTCPC